MTAPTLAAGSTGTLYLDFYDEGSGALADPASIELDITFGEVVGSAPDVAGPYTYQGASSQPLTPGIIWRIGTGQYACQWAVPAGTPAGVYTANWTCVYSGRTVLAVENFNVTGYAAMLPTAPSADLGYWTGSIAYTPPASNLAAGTTPVTIPLGGVDSNGTAWLLNKISGWDSPPVQGAGVLPMSGDHGAWPAPQFYAARTITLTVTAIAQTQALRDVARAMLQQAVPVSDMAVFTYNEPVPKMALVRRSGKVTEKAHDLFSVTFTIGLIAVDPRKYSAQQLTASAAAIPTSLIGVTLPVTIPFTLPAQTPGGLVQVTNAGTFETRPVVTIQGPLTSPALVNVTTGQTVSWSGLVLGATDQLVVDFLNRQAAFNGAYRSADLASSWWVMAPGVTLIQLSGSQDAGATMQVAWRHAWI